MASSSSLEPDLMASLGSPAVAFLAAVSDSTSSISTHTWRQVSDVRCEVLCVRREV